jgi:predicted ATPase/signal transduction histidine kinase
MLELRGYTIRDTIYASNASLVYSAVRDSDNTPVILRTCIDTASASQWARLSSSAEILKSFNHPNIVEIIDVVEHSGHPVLIMPDNHSMNLGEFLAQSEQGRLNIDTFLTIAIQLADALSIIHHGQVIHKDLHPGNILINPETLQVRIIDFGLASLLSREQPALEPPENLEGVMSYISPEQTGRMNRSLDYRSDFYTLGVTFYQLLSGQLPFIAEDAIGLVHAHIAQEQKPLSKLRPDIPQVVSDIIDKMMLKTAELRYQSALGLKKDLDVCRRNVLAGTEIPPFTLGLNDISDRFQVPQVLYGREHEVEALMESFYLAAKGKPQLLAVKGFAGIGKSALVHEVHKPIAAHSGIFISGKFDQFQKNIPYSALKQALSGWIQHALSLKENALENIRERLLRALGENARVLVDFMDIFKVLLGDQPPVPKLGAQEAQNRFHLVIQRFIKVVTRDRPLVIFIDDLQWADRGTLNLLPKLLDAGAEANTGIGSESGNENDSSHENESCRLLLLVAYRDNEVDDNHPAIETLNGILGNSTKDATLYLEPLSVGDINQLLVDALHQTTSATNELAVLIEQKTQGNPFFVNEFLKTLYSEKLLNFNLVRQQWQWSIKDIRSKDITNNVVELMLSKMEQLPEDTQKMLRLAACIGSLFDLQTLCIISEQDMSTTIRALWPALKEGLLLQEGGDWLLGMVESQSSNEEFEQQKYLAYSEPGIQLKTRISPTAPHCRFLHDRMLQAAYHSLSDEAREQAHLDIGRLLLKNSDEEQIGRMLFAVVEQLNQGKRLIVSPDEAIQVAELNLQAAYRAKQASAWDAADRYATIGMELLPENCWQADYNLSYRLHYIRIECDFLTSNHATAQSIAEQLQDKCQTCIEEAELCLLLASQFHINSKYSIRKGLEGLRLCGLDIPDFEAINSSLIESEFLNLNKLLKQTNPHNIDFKGNPSQEISIAYSLYAQLAGACQMAGESQVLLYIVYKAMYTVLQNEKSENVIVLYTAYSVILAKQGNYEEAYLFAADTLKLIEHHPKCADIPYIYTMLGTFVVHFRQPISEAVNFQLKAHELGYEYGDVFRGVISGFSNAIINLFSQGFPLNQLRTYLQKLHSLIDNRDIKVLAGRYYSRLVDMLSLKSSNNLLIDDAFDSSELQIIQSSILSPFIEHLRLNWYFWSDQLEDSFLVAEHCVNKLIPISGFVCSIDHRFMHALLACKVLKDKSRTHDTTATIEISEKELTHLANLCPENFDCKLTLLLAEKSRFEHKDTDEVAPLYEHAISSAAENDFIQYQALANELYAEFWLTKGLTKTARSHMKEAVLLYRQWGCNIKVRNLNARYKDLLLDEQLAERTFAENSFSFSQHATITRNRTITATQVNSQDGLDLLSVMKSAQAISSELAIKNLISKVILAILENSGAQTAALILNTPTGPMIEASVKVQSDSEVTVESRTLNDANDLPISLVNYVLRTNTDQLYQEETKSAISSANTAFLEDPYLQSHQPKSVLCIPVSYREKVLGALYLENTLTHNAFPAQRFDIIKMLLAQAAISFENARLFNEVSELNANLESKVKKRTKELDKTNRELNSAVQQLEIANKELETFSYTVSHDLRAPLRTIRGFGEILMEDFLEELDPEAKMLGNKILGGAEKMGNLIEGLLDLSRMQKLELIRGTVSLTAMAEEVVQDLREQYPERNVDVEIDKDLVVNGDQRMMYSVIENLFNNAWKYSSKVEEAKITFKKVTQGQEEIYIISDNGAGFDMQYIDKLFGTFQRLHSDHDFRGTGVGLATVKRVINKHGGRIWADSELGKGANFYFTIGK